MSTFNCRCNLALGRGCISDKSYSSSVFASLQVVSHDGVVFIPAAVVVEYVVGFGEVIELLGGI